MQELATLASIVAALSVGVISPGPSFVMVPAWLSHQVESGRLPQRWVWA